VAAKLLAHGVGRENSGRKGGGVVTPAHTIANGIIRWNAQKTDSRRIMGVVVGDLEGGEVTTGGSPLNMPQEVETVGGAGHGAPIHVSARRSIGMEKALITAEGIIDFGAGRFHRMSTKVEGVEGLRRRIQGIRAGSKELHVGAVG
jgi:hypothetical protein